MTLRIQAAGKCRKLFLPVMAALCFIAVSSPAQVIISGRVTDSRFHVPLYPATVFDTTSGLATYADSTGHYRIEARAGDVILYKYLGFYTKEYIVPKRLEYITHHVELVSKREKLKTVEVHALTPYQQDSLERIRTFGHYLKQPVTQFMDRSTPPSFGLGFVFHPFTYFSKKERRKRKFHKRYKHFEKDAFVRSRYTPALVQKLTGLKGDSLRLFMRYHQPGYRFTRYASPLEFGSWITLHCKAWRDSLQAEKMPK